jgi:hypothetical protein
MNVDGTDARQLLHADDRQADLTFTCDGREILYIQDNGGDEMYDMFALSLAGGPPRNLTNTDQTSETRPLFSRDGTKLAFDSKDKISPSRNIAVMAWPSGPIRLLTHETDRRASWWPVCWSPDGSALFANRLVGQEMRSMETNDSTEERLRDAILQVQSAAISKQIFHLSHVFTGDLSGYFSVNSTFVVGEDELAPALHERLDATVKEFFKEHNIVPGGSPNPDKEVDKKNESADKVVPIYGVYKQKDGFVHARLTQGEIEKLDYISNLTGLDRDSALETVLNRYLEKMKPDIERLKREKKGTTDPGQ